jgi:hypothetical protein
METILVKNGRHTRTLLNRARIQHYEREDHFLKGVGDLAKKAFHGIEKKVTAKTVAKANAQNGTNVDVKTVQDAVLQATKDRGIDKQVSNAAKAVVTTAGILGLGAIALPALGIGAAGGAGAGAGGAAAGGTGAAGLGATGLSLIKKPTTPLTDVKASDNIPGYKPEDFLPKQEKFSPPQQYKKTLQDIENEAKEMASQTGAGQALTNIWNQTPKEIQNQVKAKAKSGLTSGKKAVADIITNNRTSPELLPKTKGQKQIENDLLRNAPTNASLNPFGSDSPAVYWVIGGVIALIVLAIIFRK